ncbi:MAG: ABC transporter ATP-binding protein [Oscillospiraceae bacterium]|nr:ABC transporter ATP-binding protein [Oscillospiraceae bacterium]
MSNKYIMQVEKLNIHHGDLQAIHDVSMNFERGAVISIIGANGAGKSTLLNALVGLHKPTSGKITFCDENITGMLTSKITSKGLSMTPEGSGIFEDMTIMENLLLGSYLPEAKKVRNEQLKLVFELFPVLKEKEKQLATFLSGGQRQMLAIARAIMAKPKMIICDEISLGLAPVIIKDIYRILKMINETGVTLVIVEQEVKRSLKYSDYAYVLVKGRVVMEGPSQELPETEVSNAYFGIDKYN